MAGPQDGLVLDRSIGKAREPQHSATKTSANPSTARGLSQGFDSRNLLEFVLVLIWTGLESGAKLVEEEATALLLADTELLSRLPTTTCHRSLRTDSRAKPRRPSQE